MDLKKTIRTVMDFPKKGIGFKDITTLLVNGPALHQAIRDMAEPFRKSNAAKIVSIESRGFIFGMPMAYELGLGFVPVRKPKKLPAATVAETYALEYGTDSIEIHKDAIVPGEKVLLVDDLLATGGTMEAAVRLVKKLGGEPVAAAFLIELDFLKGREKLPGIPVHSLIHYDSEA
ncbi:MAG: adenine phosphoribosyltransferase [Candidatus Raymondbacteria bacterium RifOxyA12_full_50_37]|uniref:Adenine phosphoribosyltransferase n=1 Tax=Candidatus Raymondbacteria bacterium RIFOXYD12_FULL_49_13 TaxID=1817890 RepID=A0A1F7FKY2_UNCRA|nr:MAG: adenine phosphoribosyltransferase [Candidatus Raymondbacteria bacterium RifOxyA12_full_50_37]OGJ86918.1 MAG: adenine phosphoribosyltransferase [Candidatus Raymondbacteria bacterium RifOxyB12_full_50_8]OGJ88238.1 MAG: adenine phosphoribosyltransferase [Candidatus Raymondbacteria bacterium RIFOXYA2_FULL_49_16]OGJ97105.1 MAG: adenine phosphoribosyltransferase [Candidatus Raymondbacteria bacterium RifOxyC12_full_50_8]OGK07283.1 MAG: adenine phosphoribosyltransferase [Candidatus Raymondbacte